MATASPGGKAGQRADPGVRKPACPTLFGKREDDVIPRTEFRRTAGRDLPVLVWRWRTPVLAISSSPLGGGIGLCHWAVNAQVGSDYARQDPDQHLALLARSLRLDGPGVGMITAADVSAARAAEDCGVAVVATVGLGIPVLAAARDEDGGEPRPGMAGSAVPGTAPAGPAVAGTALAGTAAAATGSQPRPPAPGTINIVAAMPAALAPAALVNAVITVTEAKTQALMEAGIKATGTASDAVCVVCPADGAAEPFCGPRSAPGARLARAVHAAVLAGAMGWLSEAAP